MLSKSGITDTRVPEVKTDKGTTIDNDIVSDQNPSSSPSSTDGIYFQGRPLKPSEAEINKAHNTLSKLIEMPETFAESYNRKEMFGYQSASTVGKIEHRDVTYGIFANDKNNSRAVGGYLIDPYTGERVDIVSGSRADTDLEHLVALEEIYRS